VLARNQLVVLRLLTEAGGAEMSGLEVANALETELGGFARSSAYAALAALQRDGYVSGRWDTSGSHPQRKFVITAEGARALAQEPSVAFLGSPRLSLLGGNS